MLAGSCCFPVIYANLSPPPVPRIVTCRTPFFRGGGRLGIAFRACERLQQAGVSNIRAEHQRRQWILSFLLYSSWWVSGSRVYSRLRQRPGSPYIRPHSPGLFGKNRVSRLSLPRAGAESRAATGAACGKPVTLWRARNICRGEPP